MPSVGRIELEIQSIGNRLARIKEVLLPEQISEHYLSQWVMGYDALLRGETEPDFNPNEFGGDNYSYEWNREVAGYFTASILQSRIPFYFASLFHIGRQWKVTETALEDCTRLQSENNLLSSARNLARELQQQINEQEAQQLIMELCESAISRHETNLATARNWWQTWQTEVREYWQTVNQIQEYADNRNEGINTRWFRSALRLMFYSSKPSALQGAMAQHGVRFKTAEMPQQSSSWPFPPMLSLMSLASLMALMDDPHYYHYFDHFMHDYRHFMYEYVQELREARMAPVVDKAMNLLREKYGTHNPFLQYSVGQNAATEVLLQLIHENTLPNNSESTWLTVWKKTLLDAPSSYSALKNDNKAFDELVKWATDSADSTIKRSLTPHSRRATESWHDFLQRLFEKQWIETIGHMMAKENKESRSSTPQWTPETFHNLVSKVVENLNKIGYMLHVPALGRIKVLMHKATKGEATSSNAW